MGTKDPMVEEDGNIQSLSDWIVMLDIDQIYPAELNYIEGNESHNIDQMIKEFVFDSDVL